MSKVIPRFLPYRVGKCLYLYLQDIIPFRYTLDPNLGDNGFLFSDGKGGFWDTNTLTKQISSYTSRWASFNCNTSLFRHITKAFDRAFIRGEGVNDDEDEDDYAIEEELAAHDIMQGHSVKVAGLNYGLDSELLKGLTVHSIDTFRSVSDRWQKWYKLDPRLSSSGYSVSSRISVKPAEESVAEKSLRALRKCFGDDAKWRSDVQRQAVEAVIAGVTPLTVIMPTAGGKSACIWLPTLVDEGKSTIVVVPMTQLAKDVVTRCTNAGVKAKHWELKTGQSSMRGPMPPVIVVVSDTSNTPEFHTFAMELYATNILARVIYDEAHYVLTHPNFRPQLLRLRTLMIPIQIVCLTATLPPCQESIFEESMCVRNCHYIRTSTNRTTTAYSVRCAKAGERVEDFVVNILKEWKGKSLRSQKILTYACSVKQLEYMRDKFGGSLYNREKGDKVQHLEDWELGKNQAMFATGALGAGFNVQNVMSVVHCGEPWGITDFIQESGRAGRENEEVTSVIAITPEMIAGMAETDPNTLTLDKKVMREYIQERECLRKVIAGHFDGLAQMCEESKSVLCGLCLERKNGKNGGDTRNINGKRSLQEIEWNEMSKRGRIEERLQDQYDIVSSEAERRALVDKYIGLIGTQCTTCWLFQVEHPDHKFLYACKETKEKLGCTYGSMSRQLYVKVKNLCCWTCKRPAAWCDEFRNAPKTGKNECEKQDVIFPVVLMAYMFGFGVVQSVLGNKRVKDRDEFIAWMIQKSDKSLIACTNAQVVFEAIIGSRER